MDWYGTWKKRIVYTVDKTKVDADLTAFPLTLFLEADNGQSKKVFDEIGANFKKIAIVNGDDDELYVEKELWDNTEDEELGILHASRDDDTVSSAADTEYGFYYDSTQDDNTDYIGDTQSTPAKKVWDSNFKFRSDMKDKTTSTVEDSTSNDYTGNKKGANEPEETDGKIGKGQDFDGSDDRIVISDPILATFDSNTAEVLFNPKDFNTFQHILGHPNDPNSNGFCLTFRGDETGNPLMLTLFSRWDQLSSATNLTTSGWNYIAVTYNRTHVIFYLNGVQLSSHSKTETTISTSDNFNIGGQMNTTPRRWFEGGLDEVRLSTTVRSAAYFKANHNNFNDTLITWGDEEIDAQEYRLEAGFGTINAIGQEITISRGFSLQAGFGSILLNGFIKDIRYREFKHFELFINGIDRETEVIAESVRKQDNLNEQRDTLNFQLVNPTFTPEVNQEVELYIDTIKEFGGVIIEIEKSIRHGQMVVYNITCGDYAQFLNRKLVLERFENETINDIIDFIVDKYADDFTIANVNAPIEVKTMTFNRTTMTEALDKMAKAVGYSWYVDYNKDIHFFPKSENPAPFIITETNGNYLQNTLHIKDDLTQIRNVVVIRGSEERGEERTETYIADGDQITFPTTNKFAEIPVVNIESTTQIVGVDYLTKEEDADCFWSYGEKYIRFKEDTKPMEGEKVSFTGVPLFPIIVKIPDPVSIGKFGEYEFFKEDKSIKSREEALKYAQAQLESYAEGIIEGEFETDKTGLRSGQLIRIQSDLLGIDEKFLIQSVYFRMESKDKGLWVVKLATLRTIGIIQVLQDLIRKRDIKEFDPDNILTLTQFSDNFGMSDTLQAGDEWVITSPPYLIAPADEGEDVPDTNYLKFNFGTISAVE